MNRNNYGVKEIVKRTDLIVTNNTIKRYEKFTKEIQKAYETSEKSMLTIAGSIAAISAGKLFEAGGYTNVYDYCQDMFSISRGSVSECIKVWEVFGDAESGKLLEEYTGYNFTQLKLMRKLCIENREKVDETWSTREIEAMLKEEKAMLEEKDAESETATSTQESDSISQESDSISQVAEEIKDNVIKTITLDYTIEHPDELVQMIYDALSAGKKITLTL